MCLGSRIRIARIRVFIGLAVVGSLVVFTYESAYIKQKYASRLNASASAGKKSFLSLVVGCKSSMVPFLKKLIYQYSHLRVPFFKKTQEWIHKLERIRKRILRFFTAQINPISLGSSCVKGTEKSTLGVDSTVPLKHHDPKDLALICLVKKRRLQFRTLLG